MGQKITEYPQVDYWVKLTKEADKAGATLPSRSTSDVREMSKFAEMQRARYRSSFSVNWSPPTPPAPDPEPVPEPSDEPEQ